jgi:predicted 2-oxoglutarate/Fe(II)-dependent dioxygenase YbiX
MHFLDSFIDPDLCKSAIDLLSVSKWIPAKVVVNYSSEEVKLDKRQQEIINLKDKTTILSEIAQKVLNVIGSEELEIDLLQYQKTSPGGFFEWHPDYYEGSRRVVSALLYLNDVEEGGETDFVQDDEIISVIPQAGNLVIFDADVIHRGNKVINGIKYTLLIILRKRIQ